MDILSQLKKCKTQKEWDNIDVDGFSGQPFYVIDTQNEIIDCYYIKRVQKPFAKFQGLVIQYYVKDDTIHSYTIGARSGDVGERFHTSVPNVVKSFKRFYPLYVLDCIGDDYTREMITNCINDYPEHFI